MRYTIIIIAIIGVLCSFSCVSVKRGPIKAYAAVKEHNITFDAIIVPGIPFENNHWDSIMKARVIWSWVLYKNGVTKNIIYSGNAVYSPYYESKIMGLYAQELGIPKEHIYYDTTAKHSTENAFYSYLVAKKAGFKSVALATDPFQSTMLKSFTDNKMGTPLYHIPFVIDSVKHYNHLNPVINPVSAKKENFVSIVDKEKPLQRFIGTMGGNINWRAFKDRKLPPL